MWKILIFEWILLLEIQKKKRKLEIGFVDAGPPVFPKDFFNRNGTSRDPPQRLPWPPCPALFVTIDRHTTLLL